jgi:hypothetical protein
MRATLARVWRISASALRDPSVSTKPELRWERGGGSSVVGVSLWLEPSRQNLLIAGFPKKI